MIKMNTKWIGLLFAAVFIMGCAKTEPTMDPRFSTPEKTYELWLQTALNGDIVSSMDCVTEGSKKIMDIQAKGRDIFIEKLTSQAKLFKEYEIIDVKIKDNRAVILLEGPKRDVIVIPFDKEPEGWKVNLMAMFNM